MDNDINELKNYIEKKDYNSLEEFLSIFMIPLKKIHNEQFDILCYSIENECSDEIIKNIYKWSNIKEVDYLYFINNKFISPLLYSFIYKKYEIIEFLIKKGANINKKYNNMSLVKYLINNGFFNKDIITTLVKNKYKFSRDDFNIIFLNDFYLIILTFEQITIYNKNIEYEYNNKNNKETNKRKRKLITKKNEKGKEIEKQKEKDTKENFKQEINIPFMWYISLFKERKFKKILHLFKYETSNQRFNGIKFFDNQFKYLNKKEINDIQFHFLFKIITKRIEIPKFHNTNNEDFKEEIQLKNKFKQILIKKKELYKKILKNNDSQEIDKFKNNNKFFLKFIQKKP
ncbi:hypothetical protein H8356DRAFT_1379323 [Neocallimastix lanati (nom. inval.)]|uniref:Ankyrin n=1 Tax=Neocallimastix californiae TaxID=1754190 RepID=A0A1Y2A5S8_9FUNG|nr:hypothetical protein H8356DRAFT_1379323 [Neocallimastix sp. JGI-2020a]ORY17879.1 hypothetical protein LY90DRAFT_517510 [Neocallimastix californiae]|eukprot:ORY17879.1 hypothetical protein LY90DRAFT_517510 [Neocallimastix californiae]